MEIRALQSCELRASDNRKLQGYAAVFNQLSEPLQGFRERIKPGAFANSMKTADVRALVDHDPSKIIGRTRAGTLTLNEDGHGLFATIILPDNSLGHDLFVSVKRGDLSQMSFGFVAEEDAWPERGIRELISVRLFDVSVVTYSAYPQTEVGLRGLNLRWYTGSLDEPRIIVPDVTEQERLRLRLRLAQSLK